MDSDPLVPPGHFYSPVVDPADPHALRAMAEEANPHVRAADLGLDEKEMLHWLNMIAREYPGPSFPAQRAAGMRYYYENTTFPLMDALALLTMMVHYRPKRYIEVGCGFSSAAAADILDYYQVKICQTTFIDPNPGRFLDLAGPEMGLAEGILPVPVQDVSLDLFRELGAGDILFLDSSHVAKTGSDVVDYLFRIFPALRPGVLIHVHDVFYPFEYPAEWITKHNRSWNEAYFLRAFLANNQNYRVFFMSDWAYKCRRALMEELMPECVTHRGGSLWMEKVR